MTGGRRGEGMHAGGDDDVSCDSDDDADEG